MIIHADEENRVTIHTTSVSQNITQHRAIYSSAYPSNNAFYIEIYWKKENQAITMLKNPASYPSADLRNELLSSEMVTLLALQITIHLIGLISNAFAASFIVRHHDRSQVFRRLTLFQCTLGYGVNFIRILLILRLIPGWDWPKNMTFFLIYRLLNIFFTTMVFVCEDLRPVMRYLNTFHEAWMESRFSYVAWFFICCGVATFCGIFCTGSIIEIKCFTIYIFSVFI